MASPLWTLGSKPELLSGGRPRDSGVTPASEPGGTTVPTRATRSHPGHSPARPGARPPLTPAAPGAPQDQGERKTPEPGPRSGQERTAAASGPSRRWPWGPCTRTACGLGPGAACPAPAPWRKWPERRIHAGFWAEGQRPGRPEMGESGGGDGGAGAGHAARASGPPQPPARGHRHSCLNRAQDTAGCQRPPEARGPGPGSSTSQPERSPTGGARTTDTPCPQPRRPEPEAWVGAPPRPRPRARGQRRLLCPPRPSLGVCLSLSPRMGTRSQGIGPTPVTPFHLSAPRSHSGILGVRAPTYEFWGHNAARDMAAQHTFGVLQR